LRRPRTDANETNLEWLAIVSTLNVILSCLILYKFHFSPVELMTQAVELVKAALRRLFFTPATPEPPARMIPAVMRSWAVFESGRQGL
jgi:hypothetical protein